MLKERKPFLSNVALRQAREEKNWSQQQVAALLGTSTFTVCRWECGSAFPSPHYRQKLCELFGKLPRELGLLPQNTPRLDEASTAQSAQIDPASSPQKPLYTVVQPPDHSLTGRESLLATLKTRLCTQKRTTLTALCGLPGVGKTALALELIYDDEIRMHFPDGILWVRLGQSPDILSLLGRWAVTLGLAASDIAQLDSIPELGQALTALIGERRLLFVIDDAWNLNAAQAFKIGSRRCSYLLTTRLPSLALQFAHEGTIKVPALPSEEGLQLLTQFIPSILPQAKVQIAELVQAVGGLPLALVLMGHYLQAQAFSGHPRRIQKALVGLREAAIRFYLAEPYNPVDCPPGQATTILRSLQTVIAPSIQILGVTTRTVLRALALCLSQFEAFSETAALAVCNMHEEMLTEQLDMLLDAGLLASDATGCYTLHPTIVDYLRLQEPESETVAFKHVCTVSSS